MTEDTKTVILEHALRDAPREACGLVVNVSGKERYFPCRNIAENQSDFILDPEDFMRAEDAGEVMAVVHSHPHTAAEPSQADRVSCEASGLPWHIVAVPSGVWETIYPVGYRAPLLGREFSHANLDCYALVKDWFFEAKGIRIMDFERSESWWTKGGDLLLENFEKAGFVKTDEPLEVGDVIFMQIGSPVANHAAVYIGDDLMIHHASNRLSCREVYGGWFKKITRLVVRYRGIQ